MSTSAVRCLQEALRRSFKTLETNRAVWRSSLAEFDPLIESLGNLAEQLSSLSRVHLSETPLRVFPELRDALQFKLLHEVDSVLSKLNEKMCCLQSVRDAVGNQVSAVLQLYEQHADALDVSDLTERSAATPSLADMLEWLQDAERFYRRQFLQRKTLLQMLRSGDLSELEAAPKKWKTLECPGPEQQISDRLCQLSFFLD